jgi:ribosomal protein S18 acetylase RimI-like enzyme
VGVNESGEPSFSFRPGKLTDAHDVALFHTECWREAYRGIVPQAYLDGVTAADREIRWRDRLTAGVRRTVLALSADRLVGVVSWGRSDVPGLPALELMSLYVAASLRSSGVADELVACSIGFQPAHLLVFEANRRAQAFYRRHGFEPDGHEELDSDTGILELRMVRR